MLLYTSSFKGTDEIDKLQSFYENQTNQLNFIKMDSVNIFIPIEIFLNDWKQKKKSTTSSFPFTVDLDFQLTVKEESEKRKVKEQN